MSKEKKRFSEVSLAYNANILNLDEARGIFQKELNDLNSFIWDHLTEASRRTSDSSDVKKWRWANPEDWSTVKDGPWQNYITATYLPLDICPPGYNRFKRGVSTLYFEIRLDKEFGRFMFRARFENANIVDKNLDEKIIEILNRDKPEECLNMDQIKSNTAIIFRHELKDELFDNLHDYIDKALEICERAVDEMFPDHLYVNSHIEESA